MKGISDRHPVKFKYFIFLGKVAKKQLGNAVTVKLVEEISQNMFRYFKKNIPDTRSEESKKAGTNNTQLSIPIIS